MPLVHVAAHEERFTVDEAAAWLLDDGMEMFAVYYREIGHEKPECWVEGKLCEDPQFWTYLEMRDHLPHFLRISNEGQIFRIFVGDDFICLNNIEFKHKLEQQGYFEPCCSWNEIFKMLVDIGGYKIYHNFPQGRDPAGWPLGGNCYLRIPEYFVRPEHLAFEKKEQINHAREMRNMVRQRKRNKGEEVDSDEDKPPPPLTQRQLYKKGLIQSAEDFTQKLHSIRMKKEAKETVKPFLAKAFESAEAELSIAQLHQLARDSEAEPAMLDAEDTAWAETWKALIQSKGLEATFNKTELQEAYVLAYVAQSKVELWDERDIVQRKEDEAEPMPIQFRNLGGTDAPLHAPRL